MKAKSVRMTPRVSPNVTVQWIWSRSTMDHVKLNVQKAMTWTWIPAIVKVKTCTKLGCDDLLCSCVIMSRSFTTIMLLFIHC